MDVELNSQEIARLKSIATAMRMDVLDMGLVAGGTGIHLGGSFSCIEIIASLYFNVMDFDPNRLGKGENDRFIFSKGHGAPTLYAALHQLGLIADEELQGFKQPGSFLTGHPSRDIARGVDFSSGSLGQGLSLGVGVCLGMKKNGNDYNKCFVLLGDGECDEGSIWEAAMAAAHYGLGNLIAIVDANVLQYDGPTDEVLSLGNLRSKWESFGWEASEVDGHDFAQLISALHCSSDSPHVVIAHTVKGKGASFAEGIASWHNSRLTQDLYDQAVAELCDAKGGEV